MENIGVTIRQGRADRREKAVGVGVEVGRSRQHFSERRFPWIGEAGDQFAERLAEYSVRGGAWKQRFQ